MLNTPDVMTWNFTAALNINHEHHMIFNPSTFHRILQVWLLFSCFGCFPLHNPCVPTFACEVCKMAPKSQSSQEVKRTTKRGQGEPVRQGENGEGGAKAPHSKSSSARKRKADDEDEGSAPKKAPRRSARGGPKAQPSQDQILNYLLSPDALEECRPEDEQEEMRQRGQDMRTYAGSELSPFEELLCAVVLSRPISHRLGLRTIRTILNPPYSFGTPESIIAASPEQRHQAMWDARTQHKAKTAEQVGLIGEVVAELFAEDESDTSLDKVREQAKHQWDGERDLLQKNIKGLGKTGLDIFFRRVQWLWPEAFPSFDARTAKAVEKLGLPTAPEDLVKAIDTHWGKLDTGKLTKGDQARVKRRAFVVVCDRAISADLEGKASAVLDASARS